MPPLVQEPDASWSLRQGRSAVLAVSLKEAADRVYNGREETILNAVSDLTSLDRVTSSLFLSKVPISQVQNFTGSNCHQWCTCCCIFIEISHQEQH